MSDPIPEDAKLAAFPGQAWIHIFLSHMVTAAYAMTIGASIGGALTIFSVPVMSWSAAIAGGVVLAYFILLWLSARTMVRTNRIVPPFFMIKLDDDVTD